MTEPHHTQARSVRRRGSVVAGVLVVLLVLAGCGGKDDDKPAGSDAASATQAAEKANEKLVLEFYDRFFNDHEVEEAARVVADDYIQHNPQVPDGKAPFVDFFKGFFVDNPESGARIVRSAAQGDLVFLQVHSTDKPGARGSAVVDIFRVEDGMIVEHWDVIQEVPAEAANDNTMF